MTPRILLDPQIYDLRNLGGVAMVLGLVQRVRERWPDARFAVLTEAPDALATLLPDAEAVPYAHLRAWTADKYVMQPVYRVLPDRWAPALLALQRRQGRRFPRLARAVRRTRIALDRRHADDYAAFQRALDRADLLLVSGGSGPSEAFPATLRAMLGVLDAAAERGLPAAMVSQGGGAALGDPVRARVRQRFSRLERVLVRERTDAPARFRDLGLDPARIRWGADDAIPLVRAAGARALGDALGVSVREAGYAGVGPREMEMIGGVVRRFLRRHRAPPVALPIAVHVRSPDPEAIRALVGDAGDVGDGDRAMRHPAEVIAAAGRCRTVVAGAYHAAVFALAQGVPVVVVAGSPLYEAKLAGLAEQFGDGCRLVRLGGGDAGAHLEAALEALWSAADTLRGELLERAAMLARVNAAAYDDLLEHLAACAAERHRDPTAGSAGGGACVP